MHTSRDPQSALVADARAGLGAGGLVHVAGDHPVVATVARDDAHGHRVLVGPRLEREVVGDDEPVVVDHQVDPSDRWFADHVALDDEAARAVAADGAKVRGAGRVVAVPDDDVRHDGAGRVLAHRTGKQGTGELDTGRPGSVGDARDDVVVGYDAVEGSVGGFVVGVRAGDDCYAVEAA